MTKINFALVKSELGSWVNENSQELLEKEILKSETIASIEVVPNVKYKKTWKYLATDSLLQPAACGTPTTSGSTTLTDKEIYTKSYMIFESICPADLEDTALSLSQTAGMPTDLPFEGQWSKSKALHTKNNIEKKLWFNESGATEFEGLFNQFDADASCVGVVADFSATGLTDTQLIALYRTVIESVAEECVSMPDLMLFLGHDAFRKLSTAFINANNIQLQKFDFNGITVFDFPGAEYVHLRPVNGLNVGNNPDKRIVITPKSNLAYVTDLKDEENKPKIWWSDDDQQLKYKAQFKAGVAYKFSEYITFSKKS